MDRNKRDTLAACLTQVFGSVDDGFVDNVVPFLSWVELAGGQTLFQEGDAQDGVYFVISGRLRASVTQDGTLRAVNEVGRGETVGEMAVVTGEPRSATVIAIRDTVLAHVDGDNFHNLCNRHPELSLQVSKIIIERLKRSGTHDKPRRPSTICLLAITPGINLPGFADSLGAALDRWGVCTVESSGHVDGHFGAGAAQATAAQPEEHHKLSLWLDDLEFWNEFVLFVVDDDDSQWTRRCLRHADAILLLARADAPPEILEREATLFGADSTITSARQMLVLLHDADTTYPKGTTKWLDRRPVDTAVHIRPESSADVARLARIVSGNAIGLVLGGGGARGFAHLGVYKALEESGVQVDFVAGTSIGAAMGGALALDLRADVLIELMRRTFRGNPTNDFNLIPMLSLIRGRKMKRAIDGFLDESVGLDADITDTWKSFRCVATNFSQAREQVFTRGQLCRAVRASASIPIALPPVAWGGDLLVDGSVFNNFPTTVAAAMGAGRIIGVDLSSRKTRRYEHEEVPGTWELLRDKLRGSKRRKYRLPGLGTVLMTTNLLYSESLREQAKKEVDIYINPALSRVALLDWKAFDEIVELGYAATKDVLSAMSEEEWKLYRNP